LRAAEKSEAESEVRDLKRRLLEEVRKRPGDVRLLLQAGRVILQAEAMEKRTGVGNVLETAEKMQRLFDELGEQFLPEADQG